VFLHIGQGKTGTSTIQDFMVSNREALAGRGYLYPVLTGKPRHLELSMYAKGDKMVNSVDWWRIPLDGPAELNALIERALPAQIVDSGCDNVVMSDEGMYQLRPGLARLVAALAQVTDELVLVIYLRRQDDHLVSRYKQTMRDGSPLLLSEFIARPKTFRTWQYDALLRGLVEDYPSARLEVRPYHRGSFRNGSLVQDFLDAIGLPDLDYDESADQVARNTSLDAYTTEYLRRHNAQHGRADRKLRRRLSAISDGPDLRLEPAEHQAMWEFFLPGNERLVQEFLPGAGDVFLSPPTIKPGLTQREVTDEDLARVEERLRPRRARRAGAAGGRGPARPGAPTSEG
jgi:hypothetical protein